MVADDAGEEHFSGPSCAKANIGESEERILDVSRIALCVVVKEDPPAKILAPPSPPASSAPKSGDEPGRRPPLPPLDKVETYVRLRCEMMEGFRGHASVTLRAAFQELEGAGALSEASKVRISGLMRNAQRDNSVFSDANIRRCIAIDYWLRVALDHIATERTDFLKSMQAALHSSWRLTRGQISGINSWGQNLRRQVDDFPLLDVDAFEGVTLPEFMQNKPRK